MQGRRSVPRCVMVVLFAAMVTYTASALAQQGANPGSVPEHSVAALEGVAIDSIHGGPLAGAIVTLEGAAGQATTDTLGRFRLDSVPPGAHRVGVFHPLLDSLGIGLTSAPLTFTAGNTVAVRMATPSGQTMVALVCRGQPADAGPSVVMGHILDADTDAPVAGAKVSLSWVELQISNKSFRRTPRRRDTTTGPDGGFRFCGVPATLQATIRALGTGSDAAVGRPLALRQQYVGLVTLHVPSMSPAPAAASADATARPTTPAGADGSKQPPASRPTAVLTGRILGTAGHGMAGARAVVIGADSAVAGDSGDFAIRGLPTGTRVLLVRALGWEPVTTTVDLTSRSPRTIVVPLVAKTAVLDTVIIAARLSAGYERVGFEQRRRQGAGHFLTADAIAQRNAFQFHELLATMPGVRLSYVGGGNPQVAGARGGSSCVHYEVDGVGYQELEPGDIDNYIRPAEIGALEVYQIGEMPAGALTGARTTTQTQGPMAGTMSTASDCLTILVWTKTRLGL